MPPLTRLISLRLRWRCWQYDLVIVSLGDEVHLVGETTNLVIITIEIRTTVTRLEEEILWILVEDLQEVELLHEIKDRGTTPGVDHSMDAFVVALLTTRQRTATPLEVESRSLGPRLAVWQQNRTKTSKDRSRVGSRVTYTL